VTSDDGKKAWGEAETTVDLIRELDAVLDQEVAEEIQGQRRETRKTVMIPTMDRDAVFVVVRLDDPRFGAGPATVLEVFSGPIQYVLPRYQDRDGARAEGVRFWRSSPGVSAGDRVSIQPTPPQNNEAVDGAGLPLNEHVAEIAKRLNLTEDQTVILVSELRNALVPAAHYAKQNKNALRGIDRVLALMDALAKHGLPRG